MKRIILILILIVIPTFAQNTNIFYIYTEYCRACLINPIKSCLNFQNSNYINNETLFIFNNNDKDLIYLFNKNFNKPNIIIDDNIQNNIINKQKPVTLEIINSTGQTLLYNDNFLVNPLSKNDYLFNLDSIKEKNKIFDNVYSIEKVIHFNDFLYICNKLDNKFQIFDLKKNTFLPDSIFNHIYELFVAYDDNIIKIAKESGHHCNVLNIFLCNNKIYATVRALTDYTTELIPIDVTAHNDTVYKERVSMNAAHIFFSLNKNKLDRTIMQKVDTLKGFLMYPLDSNHFICRHLRVSKTGELRNFLSVYNTMDKSYDRVLSYSDIPAQNDERRYLGIGELFEYDSSDMYFNYYLDILIKFHNNKPEEKHIISDILQLDSINPFNGLGAFYKPYYNGNNIYIIKHRNDHIEKLYKISKDFKLENEYIFPEEIIQKYNVILPIKTQKAYLEFLTKNSEDEWFYHKLPYSLMKKQ